MGSSAMMDFLASTIIFGVLMFTIGRVQVNLNSTMYYNTYNYMTQNFALELSKTVEHDFHKIGFNVSNPKIDTAEIDKIRFKYYILNDATMRTVSYELGALDTTSENPDDRILYRTENGATVAHAIGVTEFDIRYYNKSLTEMTAPITGSNRDSIHAVQVRFRVESHAPIILPDATQYISVFWEKLIYPRNLGNLQ
ncbi:MAG: hypothetical protein L0Y80_05505 [Ignavibacteriae bacterium]|nr:hypothetical protein [Ignavibacteriota bacterium]